MFWNWRNSNWRNKIIWDGLRSCRKEWVGVRIKSAGGCRDGIDRMDWGGLGWVVEWKGMIGLGEMQWFGVGLRGLDIECSGGWQVGWGGWGRNGLEWIGMGWDRMGWVAFGWGGMGPLGYGRVEVSVSCWKGAGWGWVRMFWDSLSQVNGMSYWETWSGPYREMEMREGSRSHLLHMIVTSPSSSPELLRFLFTWIVRSSAGRKSPSATASTLAWILKCWRCQSPAIRGHSSGRNWESSVDTIMNHIREICQAQKYGCPHAAQHQRRHHVLPKAREWGDCTHKKQHPTWYMGSLQ